MRGRWTLNSSSSTPSSTCGAAADGGRVSTIYAGRSSVRPAASLMSMCLFACTNNIILSERTTEIEER